MSNSTSSTALRRWSWVSLIVAAFVVVLDQITKSLALAHLTSEPQHVVGPFGFQLGYNTGSAFSLFAGSSALLVIVDLVLVGVLVYLGGTARPLAVRIGLGMMLGGALGNLADRLVRRHHGGVIDFITLTHWPTFNAADASITIGAIVVAIGLIATWSSSNEGGAST